MQVNTEIMVPTTPALLRQFADKLERMSKEVDEDNVSSILIQDTSRPNLTILLVYDHLNPVSHYDLDELEAKAQEG